MGKPIRLTRTPSKTESYYCPFCNSAPEDDWFPNCKRCGHKGWLTKEEAKSLADH